MHLPSPEVAAIGNTGPSPDLGDPSDLRVPRKRNFIRRWSAAEVAADERVAYWSETLKSNLARRSPLQIQCQDADTFLATMEVADLSAFALMRHTGSAHRAHSRTEEVCGQSTRSFSLLVNLRSAWNIQHLQPLRLDIGDAVLVDSEIGIDARFSQGFEISHLKMSETWMRQWVASPGALVGKRIMANGGWGGALAAFVAQLSPQAVERSAMPLPNMVDHVGALLALTAGACMQGTGSAVAGSVVLRNRVEDMVRQRCSEQQLTVSEVAASLDVSPRTIHRALASAGQTFGALLMETRTSLALGFLKSQLYRRLTVAEIGRRAGFSDPSHFTRTIRARFGRTPLQIQSEA